MKKNKIPILISSVLLVASIGLFLFTAIQVGFAINLHVPTVPTDITMTPTEALTLYGLAARNWVVGSSIFFIFIALLALFNKFSRRTAHTAIALILFLTLLPIIFGYFSKKIPLGAGWIVFHHVILGILLLISIPATTSNAQVSKKIF